MVLSQTNNQAIATTTSTSTATSSAQVVEIQAKLPDIVTPKATTEGKVRDYFKDTPILAEIARCESHFNQFDKDGSVYRGVVNHSDVGVMQINEYYHSDTSKKEGLDIYTLDGNMAYARDLYMREGTAPWSSSQKCWGKYQGIAER